MRDYNYFTLVKKRKKQRGSSAKNPKRYMVLLLVLGLLAVFVWPAITQARLFYLDRQIDLHTQELVQDPQYTIFHVVEQKQAELARVRNIVSSMQQASDAINEKEIINENLFNAIAAILPSDTQLVSLSFTGQNVSMTGVAKSRVAIAELLYNLRKTGKFGQPYITSLSENDQLYPFSLNLELIGGAF